jgi:hypothetical protein
VRTLAAFVVLLCAAAAPAAAVISISAELNRNRVQVGEQLVLSVTISGDQASLPEPKLPTMEDFSVYDSGRSQSLNFVNGQMSSSVVYTYVLSPRAAGKFHIPPIVADRVSAPTAQIDVEVVPAGAPPAPAPAAAPPGAGATAPAPAPGARAEETRPRGAAKDVMVVASLDHPRAFVNQQVTLTVRFMHAVQLVGALSYDPPAMTGFLSEELPPVRNGMTVIDGRQYQYSEIKVALFPIQPGRLTIGPATIHCQIARLGGGGGGQDFFERFFAMAAPQPVTLNSEPVILQVDPLPPGKPDDFTGVVGRLSAAASVDRTSVKAGEAVSLTVTASGTGNVKSLPEPRKPDVPSLRFFETQSSATVDKAGDRVGGSKTFKTVVVPRVSGTTRLPSFAFPYFDPEKKAYERAATPEIVLNVAPGAADAAAPAGTAASPSGAPGLTAIADDIRYLKTAPERAPLSSALAAFADLGPAHLIPFAAFFLAALIAWRRRAAGADPRGRRMREALSRADARLKAAAALPASDAARAAALAGEALAGFTADKLDVPAAGLTLKSALDGLKALPKPPTAESLERLRDAWEEADLRRFAPGAAGDAQRFAAETAALLKTLDQELRR